MLLHMCFHVNVYLVYMHGCVVYLSRLGTLQYDVTAMIQLVLGEYIYQ